MAGGTHHDDARVAVGGQRLVQTGGEGEVAQVVGGELPFPSLFGVLLGAGHDARVVHQDVQRAPPGGGESGDGRGIGQVEMREAHLLIARRCGDVLGDAFARRRVPDSEGDCRARGGQGPGRLGPEAGGGAGDHRTTAGEIDALRHLGSRAGETEGGGEGTHERTPCRVFRCARRLRAFRA